MKKDVPSERNFDAVGRNSYLVLYSIGFTRDPGASYSSVCARS